MASVFTISQQITASTAVLVIGFPADDVNSLIFITELLGFRFNFCIIWPIYRAIHDGENTYDDSVIEQKV